MRPEKLGKLLSCQRVSRRSRLGLGRYQYARPKALEEKRIDDREESEEVDDPIPRAKKPKSRHSDLQKETLTSHTRMCEKAIILLKGCEVFSKNWKVTCQREIKKHNGKKNAFSNH